MKIYTKTGDSGQTGLFGGPRVSKDAPRIEAYGAIDELNAAIGWSRANAPPPEIDAWLLRLQHSLFVLGAELATPDPAAKGVTMVGESDCQELEQAIDRFEAPLPPLKQFILPGGSACAAALHLARTICRRAERRLVTLTGHEKISPWTLVYVNRLGDLLFTLARAANQAAGAPDVPWEKKG